MTKRPDDNTPDKPGGRAADRLREFERARGLGPEQLKKGSKTPQKSEDENVDAPTRDRKAPSESKSH